MTGHNGNIILRTLFACWVTKATYTLNIVILIALPRQKWLQERASVLRYTYIACCVYCQNVTRCIRVTVFTFTLVTKVLTLLCHFNKTDNCSKHYVQISCKDFHQKRALNMHIVDLNLFRLLSNDFQCTAFHESSSSSSSSSSQVICAESV